MNELPMNLTAERVDDGYLKVLIVGWAVSVKVLSQNPAMSDRGGIVWNSIPTRSRNGTPSFISKENFCIIFNPGWCWSPANSCFGKRPQRRGNLSMLIALGARREAASIAQYITPFLDEVFQAVKRVIWRRDSGFSHDTPPPVRRERYRLSVTDNSRTTVR